MANVSTWSTTAASNNSASPDGFPEGMAPSGVNNSGREVMAAIRRQHEDAEWIDLGHTPTYVSATSFTIPTDVTSIYHTNRRLKLTDSSTLYGKVSSSSFSSVTTVNVTLDSGSLSASLSAVAYGAISATNSSITAATTGNGALAALNTINAANLIDDGVITSAKLDSALGTWIQLEETVFANTTSVEYTSLGTYTRHRLVLRSVDLTGVSDNLRLTLSNDGGSTYETTDYKHSIMGRDTLGNDTGQSDANGAYIPLTIGTYTTGGNYRVDAEIELINFPASAVYSPVHFQCSHPGTSTSVVNFIQGHAFWSGGVNALDAIKLSGATMNSGTAILYGLLNE